MDYYLDTHINGTLIDLPFIEANVNQNLFAPCEFDVSFSLKESNNSEVIKSVASNWLGEKISILIFDKDDAENQKKYEGIVVSIKSDTNSVKVFGVSEDYILDFGNFYKSFTNKSLIAIAKEIIEVSGLEKFETKMTEDSLTFDFFQQYDETNRSFLMRLAYYDGTMFYHNGESFVYKDILDTKSVISLGLEHVSNVELDYTIKNTKFKGMPYNFTKHTEPNDSELLSTPFKPKDKLSKDIHNKSQKLFTSNTTEIFNKSVISKDIFESFLKKKQVAYAGNMKIFTGISHIPRVFIGETITCKDHAILNEKAVVISYKANFKGNVFNGFFEAVMPETRLQPILDKHNVKHNILEPAIVVDNIDPENLGRIKIKYLWDNSGNSFAWARLMHAGAGMSTKGIAHGSHFIPRLEDHVLVSCEHGDPSLPIILGALYHSEHKPDFVTDNGTEEVLLVKTPNETTIRVIDKPGGEEVIINMKDNVNIIKMVLSEPSILVESINGNIKIHSKNIEINADKLLKMTAETIEMESLQNTTITVGKDLNIKVTGNSSEKVTQNKTLQSSMNISNKAGTNFKNEAGASMEMKSTASLKIQSTKVESAAAAINEIKGALVKIN